MSVETEQYVFDINANIVPAKKQFAELQLDLDRLTVALYGALSIMRRIGLGEDSDENIRTLQHLIMVANMLRTTIRALEAEMGPVGWTLLAIGAVGTTLSLSESVARDFERRSRI